MEVAKIGQKMEVNAEVMELKVEASNRKLANVAIQANVSMQANMAMQANLVKMLLNVPKT